MSGKPVNLTGKTFWNLRVIKRVENSSSGQLRWLCECKCGNHCVVDGRFLKNGAVKSCGCLPRGGQPGELPERSMIQPSISLARLRKSGGDPYKNLACAIVAVAADDYRLALRTEDENLMGSLEKFFYSDWYRVLTNVDANQLLHMLQRENDGSLCAAYI